MLGEPLQRSGSPGLHGRNGQLRDPHRGSRRGSPSAHEIATLMGHGKGERFSPAHTELDMGSGKRSNAGGNGIWKVNPARPVVDGTDRDALLSLLRRTHTTGILDSLETAPRARCSVWAFRGNKAVAKSAGQSATRVRCWIRRVYYYPPT